MLLVFATGCVLLLLEFNFYRDTFISVWIPLAIWMAPGLLLTPFTRNLYATYYNLILVPAQAITNMIGVGGILIWAFMASNYYAGSPDFSTQRVPIKSYGYVGRGVHPQPYTEVTFDDMDKMLMYGIGVNPSKYKFVRITVSKGLWGFDVIKSKELLLK